MKSLICLLAVIVASTLADECMDQGKAMKTCVDGKIEEDRKVHEPVLKNFFKEAAQCLQQDGVKGVCNFPMPGQGPPPQGPPAGEKPQGPPEAGARPPVGAPPQGPPPQGNFSIPKEAQDCMNSIADNAGKCLTAAFPDAPKPMQFPPPPPMQAGFFHPDPKQMHEMLNHFCSNSTTAVRTLVKCVLDVVNKTNSFQAVISVVKPEIARCNAAKSCDQTFTDECKQKFAKVRTSICDCQKQAKSFADSDANCQAAKAKFPPPPAAGAHSPAQPQNDAAADHHGLPPHPGMDFCQEKPTCEQLKEAADKFQGQLNEAHKKFEQTPAAPAARR